MSGEKPSSRREFLKGRAAARALADKAQQALDAAMGRDATSAAFGRKTRQDTTLLEATRRAMACDFQVQYHASDGPAATDAMLAALEMLEPLEQQLSVYRDSSEVSAINRAAGDGPVEVEPRLFRLLELCQWLGEATAGAFDVTTGPLSKAWGFFRRQGRLPEQHEIDAALERVGDEHWRLDDEGRTIELLSLGVEINFNSIGKGFALDLLAELLDRRGVRDYLWHGGRSSVLARGRYRGGNRDDWSIGIPHPTRPGERLAEVYLRDRSLGTAGGGTQFFEHQGQRYAHVIDPRTGWPAEGVYAATAIAETCAEADALATAFYVLGPGGTAEYCAQHDDLAAIVVCPGECETAVDLHAFNLADDQWRRVVG